MSSSRSDWRCSKAYNETAFRVFVSGSCLLRVIPRFFIRIRFDITSKRYFRSLVAFFYFHPTSSSQTFISLNLQWQVVFFLFASWMLNAAPPCPAMGSSSKSIPRYFSHTSLHLWCKIRQIYVRFRVKTYRFFFLFFFSFAIYKRFEPVPNPNSCARSHRYTRLSSGSIGLGNQIAFYEIRHDRYTNKLSICLC